MALSWLQPMHLLPWVSWHSEWLAFCAMLLIALGVFKEAGKTTTVQMQFPRAAWLLVVLAVIVIFQYLVGLIYFSGHLFVVLFYLCMGILAIFSGFNLSKISKQGASDRPVIDIYIGMLAGAVLLGALCSVVLALVQAFGVWENVNWINRVNGYRRPGGNLSQTNHLATLAIMGIASIVYFYEVKRLHCATASILLVVLLIGVAITESRTGVISYVLISVWWIFQNSKTKLWKTVVFASLALSGLVVLLWLWPKFIEYVQAGGSSSYFQQARINLSAGARLVVWPQLIDATLLKPWIGWGLGEVSTAHNAVLHLYTESYPFTYAHNVVLDLIIGIGFPGALIIIVLMLTWLTKRLRIKMTTMQWYCIATVLPISVHSMLEFPFAYAYFFLPALFAIGLLDGMIASVNMLYVRKSVCFSFTGVMIACVLVGTKEYIELEEDYRVARFEVLKVGRTPDDYERPTTYFLSQLSALTEVSRITPTPDMGAERVELLHRVATRFPFFATQNRYALALALNGNAEEAMRQLQVMRVMHGERSYSGIREYWRELAENKYPELRGLQLP